MITETPGTSSTKTHAHTHCCDVRPFRPAAPQIESHNLDRNLGPINIIDVRKLLRHPLPLVVAAVVVAVMGGWALRVTSTPKRRSSSYHRIIYISPTSTPPAPIRCVCALACYISGLNVRASLRYMRNGCPTTLCFRSADTMSRPSRAVVASARPSCA